MINRLLRKLQELPIRTLLLLLVFFLGLPTIGLVVQSGVARYRQDVTETFRSAQTLTDSIAADIENQVSGARQLLEAISLLPAVRTRQGEETHIILKEFVARNPIYANILIADASGRVWTAASPAFREGQSMADRLAFRQAVADRRFSAGEYVIGKLTQKPIMNFAFPILTDDGAVSDVIMFGIDLTRTSGLLRRVTFPEGTNFIILDHQGTTLYRGFEYEKMLGKPDRGDLFERTRRAAGETGSFDAATNDGTRRLVAFRKLRLYPEEEPYAYIRAGIPYAAALKDVHTSLALNLTILGLLLLAALLLAWIFGRRLVVDRVAALQTAAQRMAAGDLQSRIAPQVRGGELGELAQSFDQMAAALEEDRAARIASEEALRASENRFRDIVMSSGDWVWEVDPQGRYTFVAGRMEETLGYTADELLGRSPLDLMPAEESMRIGEIFRELSTRQTPLRELENYNLTKDGRKICLLTNGVPILDDQGRLTGYRGVDKDITARKEEERKLRHALRQAEAASRAKNEFLTNMSHEIRTPLNGTLGVLQLLETTPLDPEQKTLVELAGKCGWNLLQLLNDILDLARVESGVMTLREEETDLPRVVEDVLSTLRLEAEKKGLNLESTIAPESNRLLVDSVRLRQILFNLVGNAIKFTPRGEVRIAIGGPTARSDGRGRIEVTVSDSGIGIPAEKIPCLGQPFTQVEGSHTRQFQGAGLGLSIVKRLVELMHGTFAVESTAGVGTVVRLTLDVGLPHRARSAETKVATVATPAGRRLKILAVEDNPINLKALQGMLEQQGHQVMTATDGEEAIRKFRQEVFDLVLMDVQMPVMDGIEAARQIRSLPGGETLPIIAITAHAMRGDRDKFLAQGMTDYLSKPYSMAELTTLVRQHTGGGE